MYTFCYVIYPTIVRIKKIPKEGGGKGVTKEKQFYPITIAKWFEYFRTPIIVDKLISSIYEHIFFSGRRYISQLRLP